MLASMHDIVVVSDLHLGRGKNPASGRYFRLEAFFYDDDFASFCRWLCADAEKRNQPFKLILNGDTFDLLRIDRSAEDGELGVADSARERRFGPVMTPKHAAETVADILAGHAAFVAGLAYVLARGYPVVMLPGNHDMELQWKQVQDEVRKAIAKVPLRGGHESSEVDAHEVARLLSFQPWFYHEPGRIWIEHGSQYDKENSYEFPLRTDLEAMPDAVIKAERDVPMGTFFQRYLYNRFGSITFIVPSSRANLRYFRWLLLNRPRLLARVATSHFPFFLQVVRRIAKAGGSTQDLSNVHTRTLDSLATDSKLGEKLQTIDGLKAIHGSAASVARGIFLQTFKMFGIAMLLALLVAGLWFGGFQAIAHVDGGVTFKAFLFIVLNFLFLTTITGVVGYLLLRPPAIAPSRPAREAAKRISGLLNVPIVSFGHSHDEVVFRIGDTERGPCWYYNTGTWVAVFTHDELLPRERVQFTFLRVREFAAELLYWSPGRGEAVPVILLEDDRWGEPERPSEKIIA